jgi:Rieske Fe-S protein
MAPTGQVRRRFLGFLTSLVLLFIGLLVAIPAVAFFLAPLRRKAEGSNSFLDAGPVSDFEVGKYRLVPVEWVQQDGWRRTTVRQSVWVRKLSSGQAGGDYVVLSSICPHLGCPINWVPSNDNFVCPCHGGIFNFSGTRTAGPPPRSMDPLEWETRNGRLWIRWQDFKIGIAERVPVNV